MKTCSIFLAAVFLTLCPTHAGNAPVPVADDLLTMREDFLLNRQRALIPVLQTYLDKLKAQKKIYFIGGHRDLMAQVDQEIRNTSDQLSSAYAAVNGNYPMRLIVISAAYGDFANDKFMDVTSYVKESAAKGKASIGIDNGDMTSGRDPVPLVVKEFKIVYSVNGQRKEKTFPENSTLTFATDLQ